MKAVVDGGFLHVSTEEGPRVDVLATNAQLETEIDAAAVRSAWRSSVRRARMTTSGRPRSRGRRPGSR